MRLRLRPHRPNQSWSVLKPMPGPIGPLAAPRPTARELIDVIGIGVSEVAGGVALTLLSLERYAEVSILLFRLVAPRPRGHDFFTPQLHWSISDPSSRNYACSPMMSGGGGGDHEIDYRMSYAFWPTPRSAAELTITVAEIAWLRRPYNPLAPDVATTSAGPWRFVVQLRDAA